MKRRFKSKSSLYKSRKGIIRSNEKLIILVFSFTVGIICGSLVLKNSTGVMLELIKKLTDSFVVTKASQSILNSFISYCLPDLTAVAVSCIFGLSVVGEPIICMIPCFRGLGLGLSIGCIYSQYKLDGLVFVILLVILPATLSVSAMTVACKENVLTSRDVRQLVKGASDKKINYKMFAVRNAITVTVIVLSAALASALCYFFSSTLTAGLHLN